MRRILAIFRKDARHLWPQIALLAVLLALAALLDPAYSRAASYYDVLPSFALPLACWLLIVSAIHEEKLPGDRQYWLTRPYSWNELLAAKLLFVAAFVNLPLLAYHAGVYVAVGIPLSDHLGALLWRQVFFTAFYVLPAAALAAITRGLGRIPTIVLVSGTILTIATEVFMRFTQHPLIVMFNADAATTVARAVVLAAGVSAILILQYARRRTRLAGALCVAVALTSLGMDQLGRASARVHGLGMSFDALPAEPLATVEPEARLSLDSDPARRSGIVPGGKANADRCELPIRIDGVSSDAALLDQGTITIRIDVPDGPPYLTGMTYPAELHDLSGGRAWLGVAADHWLLKQTEEKLAIVSGEFKLRPFSNLTVLPLPKGHAVTVPAVGVCRDFREVEGWIAFSCYTPSPRAVLMAGTPGIRVNWIIPPGSAVTSIPSASGFQPLTRFVSMLSYRSWEQIGDANLIAAQALPRLHVTFRLSGIRLAEYVQSRRSR